MTISFAPNIQQLARQFQSRSMSQNSSPLTSSEKLWMKTRVWALFGPLLTAITHCPRGHLSTVATQAEQALEVFNAEIFAGVIENDVHRYEWKEAFAHRVRSLHQTCTWDRWDPNEDLDELFKLKDSINVISHQVHPDPVYIYEPLPLPDDEDEML